MRPGAAAGTNPTTTPRSVRAVGSDSAGSTGSTGCRATRSPATRDRCRHRREATVGPTGTPCRRDHGSVDRTPRRRASGTPWSTARPTHRVPTRGRHWPPRPSRRRGTTRQPPVRRGAVADVRGSAYQVHPGTACRVFGCAVGGPVVHDDDSHLTAGRLAQRVEEVL